MFSRARESGVTSLEGSGMGPDISLSRVRDLAVDDATWWGGVAREVLVVAEDVKVAMDALRGKDSSDWVSNDTKDLG